jgi:hypothetical protein
MRRCMSDKRADASTVVRHYETDTTRVAKALLVVLRWREAHPHAHEETVEEGAVEERGQGDAQKQRRPQG